MFDKLLICKYLCMYTVHHVLQKITQSDIHMYIYIFLHIQHSRPLLI